MLAAPWLGIPCTPSWSRAQSQQPDSETVLRDARDAQADFEWVRRHNLPFTLTGSGGRCDQRIGRFCYWNDESEVASPPEPSRIRRARRKLLGALDRAGSTLTGDRWIAGQRVRYLLEDGRHSEALAAARACRAVAWWCTALAGLVHHISGNFARADTAYALALSNMPPDERCRWTDLSLLLEHELRKRYRRLSCWQRSGFEARFWWLAQPLYSLPANDLRTEHLARQTMARLHERARSAHGVPWGKDLHELMVRYGWPTGWSRASPSAAMPLEQRIIGHDPTPSFSFSPSVRAMDDPTRAGESDWRFDDKTARTRYAPPYAASFNPLPHHSASFRRGDSTIVVAAYDLTDDTLFTGLPLEAALALALDERSRPVVRRKANPQSSSVLVASTPGRPALLSLEVVAPRERHVARARHGLRAPSESNSGVAISDLLLFSPPRSLPDELTAVIPFVRGSARARPGEQLGLFWELYGLHTAGEPSTVSVSLIKEGRDFLAGFAELGRERRRTAVRLQWRETAVSRGGIASRAVALRLPNLSRGWYRIDLAVVVRGQKPLRAAQRIEVVRR